MRIILPYLIFIVGLWGSLSAAQTKLELAAPFTDQMILQRQSKVPVWGFAEAGQKVIVEFAGQTKQTQVNQHGEWMLHLDPLKASFEERAFKVKSSSGKSIVLKNVLVGEVWFSSGQSNMVWTAGRSMCSDIAKKISSAKKEIPIREINIETVSALYPQKKAQSNGGWKRSRDASNFSALSLSFAYELYKDLNVPIGILLSAHSNTRIEAFTQRQAIEAHEKLKGDVKLMHDADPLTEQGRDAFKQYYQAIANWQKEAGKVIEQGGDKLPKQPSLPGIAGMWRGPSQFFNGKINPVIPYAIRGAIWCQGTSNSGDGRIYASRMEALVRGWRKAWSMPEMPFYFTQMQCYGDPNPDTVGFADIRQVQHVFFMNNRKHVGMVVQSDLNSARPKGIHYFNKLHPGMRMARWALAKDYGRDIAYTGPIFSGYQVKGSKVLVSFEKSSLFGGLMVGSKGMAVDYKEEGKYVEPALPTPGDQLNHFRLCGKDKKWVAAQARIVGDQVEVVSDKVKEPMGVQYAYSAVPERSNLYNKAGLPATPFAQINHQFIFEEDDEVKQAALKKKYARHTDPNFPVFNLAAAFRDGIIVQRQQSIPVWGFANEGVKVEVEFNGLKKTAIANALQQWSVEFPGMKASTKVKTLSIQTSHGHGRTVKNILIGDVWFLSGSTLLTTEHVKDQVQPLKFVREFRRKTKASTSTKPRKRTFETGGGKYRSSWVNADFKNEKEQVMSFAYHFAKTLKRKGVPLAFVSMSSGQGGRHKSLSSPLSWTSLQGVQKIEDSAFQARLDQLMLQNPSSEIAKKAVSKYIDQVKQNVSQIVMAGKRGDDLSKAAPLGFPAFPKAGAGSDITPDMIPTYTYNWCVSPFVPMGVRGVIWVPSEFNIGYVPSLYGKELEIYAKSLPEMFGQEKVEFMYAQPTDGLVPGVSMPNLPEVKSVEFDVWPKSLEELAVKMAKLVRD